MNLYLIPAILLMTLQANNAFIPAKALKYMIQKVDGSFSVDFGEVSNTFTHEEIVKRGVVRSMIRFLRDQKTPGGERVRQRHSEHAMESYTLEDLRQVYNDYYNKTVCELDAELMIVKDFQLMVAAVDVWEHTKDLPYAHFDAESFEESNQRVSSKAPLFDKKIFLLYSFISL